MAKLKEMSVSDWIKVRDNPIQRDTERHAARAKHLLTPLSIHAITYAAELPDGKLVKLDGHTRALLWSRNQVKHPPRVLVNIIPVGDLEETKLLYRTLDAREAVETATDMVTGGFRLAGIQPQSALLASGQITNALRVAWRGLNGAQYKEAAKMPIHEIVVEFTPELVQFDNFEIGDSINMGKTLSPGAIIATFLLSYRKHGDRILPFWRSYFADSGYKSDGKMDGVQALRETVLGRRKNYGGSAVYDLCSRALYCIEKWIKDEHFSGQARPLEIADYAEARKANYRLIKPTDKGKKAA